MFHIHVFVAERQFAQKSHFFGKGKRLFEIDIAERKQASASGGRGKLMKSNSLIVASTNNIYNGFLRIDKIKLFKIRECFR